MNSNTVIVNTCGDLVYITFPKLSRCGETRHTFSTRMGGVSRGKYASMNLSFNRGDERESVLKNYEILCKAVGIKVENLVLSHQTHTNNVKIVDKRDCGRGITKEAFQNVDGLITNVPGVALVTQYADCTPLLFCDPVKRVVATSHAGWRGTVSLIGKNTVLKMQEEFGCNPKDILAAIGPSIGPCCYEVDKPVFEVFSKAGFSTNEIFTANGKDHYMLDLKKANFQILVKSGVLPENIDIADICTCCNAEEMHSHRATKGERGNLAAIIQLL